MNIKSLKTELKTILNKLFPTFLNDYSNLKDLKYMLHILKFLITSNIPLPYHNRIELIKSFFKISLNIESPHTLAEILAYTTTILETPKSIKGCFVEAGCYKGGSTAKFSLATAITKRKLIVFDSFEGIPETYEKHDKDIWGRLTGFKKGDYCGTLTEVRENVLKYGNLNVCEFIKGWFEDTMPNFKQPIAGIYLDVDLASSTRTCLKYLYPLLEPGGVLYSQDGHLPLVIAIFNDTEYWENEVGCQKPYIEGLGRRKLLKIKKQI